MSQEERVFIGKYETTFIFKVEGRLTQRSLWNANSAVQKCMGDETITDLLVDLSQCSYMDSTILGILARWAISFKKNHTSPPFLIGLEGNPLESIFKRMSLNKLFHISSTVQGIDTSVLLQIASTEKHSTREYAENLLSAHEVLAELSPENAKEFATVIQLFKADLQSR